MSGLPEARLVKLFPMENGYGRVANQNASYAREIQKLQKNEDFPSNSSIPATLRYTGEDIKHILKINLNGTGSSNSPKTRISISRMHSTQAAEYFHHKYAHFSCPAERIQHPGIDSQCGFEARGSDDNMDSNASHENPFVVVMNFANGHTPGGGYTGGARAQEECLCRQFPLYHPSLCGQGRRIGSTGSSGSSEKLYPFGAATHPDGDRYANILFTPDVELLREDNVNQHALITDLQRRIRVSFVAATAPSLRRKYGDAINEDLLCLAILNCILAPLLLHGRAKLGGKRVLILGAWGCGAFCNDPAEMSRRFALVLDKLFQMNPQDSGELVGSLMNRFWDEIHFAVPVFRPQDQPNLDEFSRTFDTFCRRMDRTLDIIGPMDRNPVATDLGFPETFLLENHLEDTNHAQVRSSGSPNLSRSRPTSCNWRRRSRK